MDEPRKKSAVPAASHGAVRPTTESAAASPVAPDLAVLLTHEDVDRARDRLQVALARWKGRKSKTWGGVRLLWLLVGPGGPRFSRRK